MAVIQFVGITGHGVILYCIKKKTKDTMQANQSQIMFIQQDDNNNEHDIIQSTEEEAERSSD